MVKSLGGNVAKIAEKVILAVKGKVVAKDIEGTLSQLHLECITLSQMRARQTELQANNYKKAKEILSELKREKTTAPTLQEAKGPDNKDEKKHSVSSHLFGKYFGGHTKLDVNDVKMGKNRNYLLSQCPRTAASAGILYTLALRQNISIFVSLLESTEASSFCNLFWMPRELAHISSRDGWKIEHLVSKVIGQGAKELAGTRDSQLVETTLLATRNIAFGQEEEARLMTHLHYDAWRDRMAAPNEELLHKLVNRIEELQGEGVKDAPFQVNCRGGIGRTGTLVAIHAVRQKIYEELGKGVSLDTIRINIPGLIYDLRKQRKSLVSGKEQLVQIYQATATFYERLQKEQQAVLAATGLNNPDTGKNGKLIDLIFSFAHGATH